MTLGRPAACIASALLLSLGSCSRPGLTRPAPAVDGDAVAVIAAACAPSDAPAPVDSVSSDAREVLDTTSWTFTAQPALLTFRMDYTGIFQGGQRTTTEFQAGAKVFSIAVSSY